MRGQPSTMQDGRVESTRKGGRARLGCFVGVGEGGPILLPTRTATKRCPFAMLSVWMRTKMSQHSTKVERWGGGRGVCIEAGDSRRKGEAARRVRRNGVSFNTVRSGIWQR